GCQGRIAPSRSDRVSFGTTKFLSTAHFTPRPSQSVHAPNGALNENNLGSSSGKVNPQIGQEKFSEKCRSSPSITLISTLPCAFSNAIWSESDRRDSTPSRIPMRSTTTSISCFVFLFNTGTSSTSYISPSTITRANPSL